MAKTRNRNNIKIALTFSFSLVGRLKSTGIHLSVPYSLFDSFVHDLCEPIGCECSRSHRVRTHTRGIRRAHPVRGLEPLTKLASIAEHVSCPTAPQRRIHTTDRSGRSQRSRRCEHSVSASREPRSPRRRRLSRENFSSTSTTFYQYKMINFSFSLFHLRVFLFLLFCCSSAHFLRLCFARLSSSAAFPFPSVRPGRSPPLAFIAFLQSARARSRRETRNTLLLPVRWLLLLFSPAIFVDSLLRHLVRASSIFHIDRLLSSLHYFAPATSPFSLVPPHRPSLGLSAALLANRLRQMTRSYADISTRSEQHTNNRHNNNNNQL